MLSVIIQDNNEPKVIQLTYENLWRELKDIPDAELIVSPNWFRAVTETKNKYVCLVEPDCLVSSGYFSSQLGLYKKNPMMRKLAMLSSATGVNEWGNRYFGYSLGNNYAAGVIPNRDKKSNAVYPVEVGFVPGALIHKGMLMKLLSELSPPEGWTQDLVFLSTQLSLGFWRQGVGNGLGNQVHINPNTTYVTTEDYVNDIGKFDPEGGDLVETFRKHSI